MALTKVRLEMGSLIHIGKIDGDLLLFLRKLDSKRFQWFHQVSGVEIATSVEASTIEEALRLARREWKRENFQPLLCGYLFTLPERDEHGNNALFCQMVKSLESMTGVYFEEELGHNCIVHQIPQAARSLYESLNIAQRL